MTHEWKPNKRTTKCDGFELAPEKLCHHSCSMSCVHSNNKLGHFWQIFLLFSMSTVPVQNSSNACWRRPEKNVTVWHRMGTCKWNWTLRHLQWRPLTNLWLLCPNSAPIQGNNFPFIFRCLWPCVIKITLRKWAAIECVFIVWIDSGSWRKTVPGYEKIVKGPSTVVSNLMLPRRTKWVRRNLSRPLRHSNSRERRRPSRPRRNYRKTLQIRQFFALKMTGLQEWLHSVSFCPLLCSSAMTFWERKHEWEY